MPDIQPRLRWRMPLAGVRRQLEIDLRIAQIVITQIGVIDNVTRQPRFGFFLTTTASV